MSDREAFRRRRPESSGDDPSSGGGRRTRSPWLPALILALLLVVLVLGALVLWRSLGNEISGTATASDSIDSGPKPDVSLDNASGQVSVEGVKDLRSVEFEVTKYAPGGNPSEAKQNASDVPVDVSRKAGNVSLRTDGGRGTGADYALRVPAGAKVKVGSGAGGVEVRGVDGSVKVVAEAGDVSVSGAKGIVDIEAPQGDVDVAEISTDTGQTRIKVGTGDVSLENLVVGTLKTSVEAGSVTLSGRFSGSGQVSVGTGNIETRVPAEDTRELALETRVGEIERKDAPDDSSGEKEPGT